MNIGGDLIGPAVWDKYKSLMSDAHRTFHQKVVIWRRNMIRTDRWGEDISSTPIEVELLGLMNYNIVRIWPIDNVTETGETDEQSMQLLLNKEYLRQNGWLTTAGYLDYNTDLDRFVIDGLVYQPDGDTPEAQMQSDDVLIAIVLKREITKTGDNR